MNCEPHFVVIGGISFGIAYCKEDQETAAHVYHTGMRWLVGEHQDEERRRSTIGTRTANCWQQCNYFQQLLVWSPTARCPGECETTFFDTSCTGTSTFQAFKSPNASEEARQLYLNLQPNLNIAAWQCSRTK